MDYMDVSLLDNEVMKRYSYFQGIYLWRVNIMQLFIFEINFLIFLENVEDKVFKRCYKYYNMRVN